MKTGNVLIFGGLAVIAYQVTQLGVAGKTLQLVFDSVKPKSVLSYDLVFLVQNISNATINFNGLTGSVTINDNAVGTIQDFSPIQIQPVSQQQLTVGLSLQLLSLPAAIIDLVNNSGGVLNFEVSGNMNVDKFVLPFDVTQKLTI